MDKILMLLLNLWSKGYTLNSQTIWDSIKLMKLWLTKFKICYQAGYKTKWKSGNHRLYFAKCFT